jgi:phosphoglycerate dehydrogenase-like enzyme
MKKKILVSAPVDFIQPVKDFLEEHYECTYNLCLEKEDVFSLKDISLFSAWMINPCPKYFASNEILDKFSSLKIIATPSTGTNHIDLDFCKNNNIETFCLRGTNVVNEITASSEFTFALLLSLIRQVPKAFEYARNGKWREVEDQLRGREISTMTIGIIGMGRIGGNVARYAHAMNADIIVYDPYQNNFPEYVSVMNSAEDVIKNADVLMNCVHLSDETYKMMNAEKFSLMKENSFFINTSRGDVVDEDALLSVLKNGHIQAAALDVISGEQDINLAQSALIDYARKNDNLIITPHIAGLSYDSETKAQMAAAKAIKNIIGN